ncbi:MAG: SPOR domain-containing protein, partial [Alphaproteobacteria bacterium]
MTVIGVAILGGGGVLAYRGLTGGAVSGEPRVVRANPEPVRVAVQQAQEQKPVNDRVPGGDRVVSREERPLSQREQQAQIPPAATPRVIPLSVPAATPDTTARVAVAPSSAGEAPTQSGVPQARPANADEPRRVRTVTVGADGQIAGQPRSAVGGLPLSVTPSAPAPVASAPSPAPQSVVPQATPVAVPAPRPPAPPVASQQAAAAPAAAPARTQPTTPRPAAGEQPLDIAPARTASVRPTQAAAPASAGGGSSFVQISSHQSDSEARSALSAAQRRFSVLQGQPTNVTSVNLGDRGTWHRARLGPMPRAEAQSLCERLKGAGGSCVVN